MGELSRYFTQASAQGKLHTIALSSFWPQWRERKTNKVSNENDLINAGFSSVIIGVSTGSNDPNSVTTGEELDASIYKAFKGGAKHVIICNNFAPHQFDTKRIIGKSDEDAYRIVEKRSKDWLEENKKTFEHYRQQAQQAGLSFEVRDWDKIRNDRRYPGVLSSLNRLYAENGANGDINFASVTKAYIRSYMARFIDKKMGEEEAERLLKEPSSIAMVKRFAKSHIEDEKRFVEYKREESTIYFGQFFTPSVDILNYLKPKVMGDLVNSAIEKITGYAIMSEDLVQNMAPDEKVAYVHHGGIHYWDEFFNTHQDLVSERELGEGIGRVAFFVGSPKSPKSSRNIPPPANDSGQGRNAGLSFDPAIA